MVEALKGLLVLGGVGFVFAVLLSVLSEKLKVKENPFVEKLAAILPGLNCGACGYSGCKALAMEMVKENKPLFCPPGAGDVAQQLAKEFGAEQTEGVLRKAVLACGAFDTDKKMSNVYNGPRNCLAAHIVGGGPDCKYGCIGFGDCVDVCPVSAISILDQKAVIDKEKCVGCGKCAAVCPRKLFHIVDVDSDKAALSYVACSNRDKGPEARKVCAKACIGCGICARQDEEFKLADNLSVYNGKGPSLKQDVIDKCPTKCIIKE